VLLPSQSQRVANMMGLGMVPGWNPHAMCDGSRAQDRAEWLMKNQGMSAMIAQQKIMSEFPNQFQSFGMPGVGNAPNWNPNVMCDGSRAEARVDWLVQNQDMIPFAAQQKIMSEFPQQFGMGSTGMRGMGAMGAMNAMGAMVGMAMSGLGAMGGVGAMGGMWNPNAICDGTRAEERAIWLQQNQGLTHDAARQKVMSEFPQQFGGSVGMGMGGMGAMGGMWNPNAMCDGSRAEDRANWLRDNKRMNIDMARQQVMQEFPAMFGGGGSSVGVCGGRMFNPNAFCDGVRAEERVLWLQQNKHMSVEMARQQVMREFPSSF